MSYMQDSHATRLADRWPPHESDTQNDHKTSTLLLSLSLSRVDFLLSFNHNRRITETPLCYNPAADRFIHEFVIRYDARRKRYNFIVHSSASEIEDDISFIALILHFSSYHC